ncbi:hypothetical protein P692DRAFT_20881162 [Suillus brevipes Sb2]|nr:hypothetical protein P692DRAFT_20881162 [Suillus brevipes Sb2]
MHPQVVSIGEDQCLSRQSIIDNILVPNVSMFTKAKLLEYIMELIMTEDKALQLVDKPAFCDLLCYVHPTLAEGDIPNCTKLTEAINAVVVVDVIYEYLTKADSRVSMTFDLWTSIIGDSFFYVAGHFIWCLDGKPLAKGKRTICHLSHSH